MQVGFRHIDLFKVLASLAAMLTALMFTVSIGAFIHKVTYDAAEAECHKLAQRFVQREQQVVWTGGACMMQLEPDFAVEVQP